MVFKFNLGIFILKLSVSVQMFSANTGGGWPACMTNPLNYSSEGSVKS